MFLKGSALCALLLLAGTGCDQDAILDKFATQEDQARATKYLEMMRHHDFTEIESTMAPNLKSPDLHAKLVKMADLLPAAEPTSRKLVGAHLNFDSGERRSNLTYQYGFGDKWFLLNCSIQQSGGSFTIVGLTVQPIATSLDGASKFTLAGKSALQYMLVLAAVLFVLLSVTALIAAILDQGLKRKWLWILCICFGVMQLSMNWTTGQWEFRPLSFLLFSAGAFSGPYSPWVISVALPVGAIVYIFRRLMNHRQAPLSNNA